MSLKCPNCLQGILNFDPNGDLSCNDCTDWYKYNRGAITKWHLGKVLVMQKINENYIYGLEFPCNVCKLYIKNNLIEKLAEHLDMPHITLGIGIDIS